MKIPPTDELLQIAEFAAITAGEQTTKLQGGILDIKQKGFRDFVTDADFRSQELILETISRRYPDHGYLTEENEHILSPESPVIWVIDPIDGTTNYSRGHPLYTIAIAAAVSHQRNRSEGTKSNLELLLKHHQLAAGAIYDPAGGEMFGATHESVSTLNKAPIKVSEVGLLEKAVIGLDWSRDFDQRQRMLEIISHLAHEVHTIRAIGSAAQALAWVACGRLDVYINLGIGPWDVAAAKVIITSAGGTVSDLSGESWNLWHPSCLASNGLLHDQLLEQIRR